jgi:two-component system, LytTR family, sensor kinase
MKNIFEKIGENRGVVLKHFGIWCLYLSYMILTSWGEYDLMGGMIKTSIIIIISHSWVAVFFYLNVYYIFPNFSKRKIVFTVLMILLVIIFHSIRYIINFSILPFLNIINRFEVGGSFALSTAYIYSQWSFYALGFYYFRKAIQHEKDLRILQENQSAAEMSFLTSQINPHFLYNTLNFFYAEALPVLPNLSKGIMLLSDMMRYAINNEEGDGKAPLENEVKHIKNFIEINQLRYGNRLYVHFELIGNTEYRRIMPLILITFVENAFKHGELLSEQTPLEISLKIEENHLLFRLKNAIRKGPKEESEGIGLVNTRRRLTVAYPERHQLNVVESEGFYEVLLKMDL